jgi:hypothetical protein
VDKLISTPSARGSTIGKNGHSRKTSAGWCLVFHLRREGGILWSASNIVSAPSGRFAMIACRMGLLAVWRICTGDRRVPQFRRRIVDLLAHLEANTARRRNPKRPIAPAAITDVPLQFLLIYLSVYYQHSTDFSQNQPLYVYAGARDILGNNSKCLQGYRNTDRPILVT